VAVASYSTFRKRLTTLEVRFPEAYRLWDKAGSIWSDARGLFADFRNLNANPGQVNFFADERFSLNISLDKIYCIDHKPYINSDKRLDVFDGFMKIALESLKVSTLNRIGCRTISGLEFKSKQDVIRAMKEMNLIRTPSSKFFNIDPINISPSYIAEIDDGDIGYRMSISAQTRKFEISILPETVDFLENKEEKTDESLVIDVDFYTMKPIDVGAFRASAWMERCERSISRDMDGFLNMPGVRHE
jgi:hypothetical protein